MSTRTIYEEHNRCSVCGGKIERDVFEAQQSIGGYTEGADCRSCLEETPDAPQLQHLYEQIKDTLSGEKRERWEQSDREDRFYFALHCINEGIVSGGSMGMHEQIRKYVCLKALDNREVEDG